RDLPGLERGRGRLVRASLQLQSAWSVVLALVLAGLALAAGPSTPRGGAMLVLLPMVAFAGLASARPVFTVLFDVRFVAAVDVATNVAASVGMMVVAAATGQPAPVAACLAAGAVVNGVLVARRSLSLVDRTRPR